MKYAYLIVLLLCSIHVIAQTEYTIELYDAARKRVVPIAIYEPKHVNQHTAVVVFNHGYGQNSPDSYQEYSCLMKPLADKGYLVLSIQHELPDDPPLAMTEPFAQTRLANWDRGVENIMFTISEFKKLRPDMNWDNLSVIGHSNGGDMAMLFAHKYPRIAKKIISLDHRRMTMPRCSIPEIYTLRGSDYEADENVIPSKEEQEKYHITVVQLKGIKHGDMDNKGTKEQHDVILSYLCTFLK